MNFNIRYNNRTFIVTSIEFDVDTRKFSVTLNIYYNGYGSSLDVAIINAAKEADKHIDYLLNIKSE